jgi:hypothetical protein
VWTTTRHVGCALALMSVVVAGGCGGDPAADLARTVPALLTIGAPADGSTTSARSIEVAGRAPSAPLGGYEVITIRANGRPVQPTYVAGGYRGEVALVPGRNQLVTQARLFGAGGQPLGLLTTRATSVRRRAGPDTGDLDRATALLVATTSAAAARVCVGQERCLTDAYCFAVGRHRTDCPVGRSTTTAPTSACRVVIAVRVRARRVTWTAYGCHGRLSPRPERLVRRAATGARHRFRTDAAHAGAPNRYGIPRFDAVRDEFLP